MNVPIYRPDRLAFQAGVRPYIKAGMTLVPLRRWNAADGKGKTPRDTGWTETDYDNEAVLAECLELGVNVGARPGPLFLVIDVDPRNQGDLSFAQFCVDTRLEPDALPMVETGGGGQHYFARLPANAPKLGKKLQQYPGIEFLSGDSVQVVCAGSKHPSGHLYQWDDFNGRPMLKDAPILSAEIIGMLAKPTAELTESDASDIEPVAPEIVADVLNQMDVTQFRDHDDWLTLMFATHAISNGEALAEFIAWSTADPIYVDHDEIITTRWNSLETNKEGGISGGTFYHIAKEHGVKQETLSQLMKDRPRCSAKQDFDDDLAKVFLPLPIEIPPMRWNELDLPQILDFAEDCLLRKGAPLYQTHGRMVFPLRLPNDANDEGLRRKAGAMTLQSVHPLRLREWMIECVPLVKGVRKTGKNGGPGKIVDVNVAPPVKLASHYLARADKWRLPVIHGIIESPTLRADGTLLTEPGYDAKSGLLLDTNGVEFPEIKDNPTREDALAALTILKTPFRDFPFVPDDPNASDPLTAASASRSVILAAVLTGLVRRGLPAAPMIGADAPTAGTGKTLLLETVSMIAIGRTCTVMSQGGDEIEDEKRLFSALLQNDPILMIDNVTRPIEGNALCTVLTQPKWDSRLLGESRNKTVETNCLILATGNNLRFKGDMRRRAILSRIDARTESPRSREFSVNLRKYIPEHRGELVAAGLTILRAFHLAGCPQSGLTPFGSFEEWSRVVRGALIWLGEPDPCLTTEAIEDDDPESQDLFALLSAIRGAFGSKTFTAAAVLAAADGNGNDDGDARLANSVAALEKAGENAKAFGNYLRGKEGKIIGSLHLVGKYDSKRKIWTYRIFERIPVTEFG